MTTGRFLEAGDSGLGPLLPKGWKPDDDQHDGHRLQIAARLIVAALDNPLASFEIYSRRELLSAVDEAIAQADGGDALRSFLAIARKLAASGSGRHLAPLPAEGALVRLALEMPNFAHVVEFYQGQAALLRMNGDTAAKFPPVLLLGPPGVGKTMFARRLAELIGSPMRILPMASQTAGWIVSGLDRSWSTSRPGLVFLTLLASRVANPVLVADELDKAAFDAKYDPVGGFYPLLEHDTAAAFIDEYVGVPINASAVIWIVTGNEEESIPKPLLSRLTAFNVWPPDRNQSRAIALRQFERVRGKARFAPLPEDVVDLLAANAPREIGVQLRVAVGRAAQRAINAGRRTAEVTAEDLRQTKTHQRRKVGFL
jgi:ATP-dependent Lon protease